MFLIVPQKENLSDEVSERERKKKPIKRPNLLIIIFFLLLRQIGFDKPPRREKRKNLHK